MPKGTISSLNPGVIYTDSGTLLPFIQQPPAGAIIGNKIEYLDGIGIIDGVPTAIAESITIITKISSYQQDTETIIEICFDEDTEILAEKGLIIGENFPYAIQIRTQTNTTINQYNVIVSNTFPPLFYFILNKNDTPILAINASQQIQNNVILQFTQSII